MPLTLERLRELRADSFAVIVTAVPWATSAPDAKVAANAAATAAALLR